MSKKEAQAVTGFSLPPETLEYAKQRAAAVGFNLSKYLRTLIEHDRSVGVLADALERAAKSLRTEQA